MLCQVISSSSFPPDATAAALAPAPATPQHAVRVLEPTVRQTPLVGRTAEWDALCRAYADPDTTFVVLTGEAGVGKSRLAEDLVAWTAAPCVPVHCFELAGERVAYSLLYRALEDIEDQQVPPSSDLPLGLSTQLLQFERWATRLATLGQDSRALLLVEDLHWGDDSTFAFLSFLAHTPPLPSLLALLTWRDEVATHGQQRCVLPEALRHPRTLHLPVRRLATQPATQLAELLQAGRQMRADPLDLVERSGGNPYLLTELIASDGHLLDHVGDLLLQRAHDIEPDAEELLRLAAVAGPNLDDRLLAQALGWSTARCAKALKALLANGLVINPGDDLRFRHDLAREALVARLLPGERRTAHQRLAEAFQARGVTSNNSARLALHWTAAGDAGEAASASVRAGHDAFCANAFSESWQHYSRALGLDPSIRHAGVLARAAESARWAGALDDAIRLAQLAVSLVEDRYEQAAVLERLGRYLWEAGRGSQSTEVLHRAAALLPSGQHPGLRASVLGALARNSMIVGDYEEALHLAQDALKLARDAGDRQVEADVLVTSGFCRIMRDADSEGASLIWEALRLAQELDDREVTCRGYANLLLGLDCLGLHKQAGDLVTQGLAYLRAHGLELGVGAMFVNNAVAVLIDRGRLDEAASVLDDVLPRQHRGAQRGLHGSLWLDRARLATLQGDLQAAEQCLHTSQELGLEEDPWVKAEACITRARLQSALGDPQEAAQTAERALLELESDEPVLVARLCRVGLEMIADLAVHGASPDGAWLFVERLTDSPAVNDSLEWGTARAELARSASSDEPEMWNSLAGDWRRAQRPYDVAYCRLRAAESLALRRRMTDAAEAAQEAYDLATEIGAHPLAREVADLQRRARLHTHIRTRPSQGFVAPFQLTAREQDVLALLSDGATNKDLAERLFISGRTAEVHVSRVLRKLGVSSRLQAAAVYQKATSSRHEDPSSLTPKEGEHRGLRTD